jgi:hypothetical protein
MKRLQRRGERRVIEQAGHDGFLERDGRTPFELDEMGNLRVLRPGEEKHVLVRYLLAQHLRPFLSAVDLLLIAPNGNIRMGCELGFQLPDERKVCSGIAQEDSWHRGILSRKSGGTIP